MKESERRGEEVGVWVGVPCGGVGGWGVGEGVGGEGVVSMVGKIPIKIRPPPRQDINRNF